MMEPDIRIKTNEQGFCLSHYGMMLRRRRMLGMGLMLESHLEEVEKKIDGRALLGNRAQTSIASLEKLNGDCYVCSRIDKNLTAMISTAVYLFESDPDFAPKFKKVPYFCLPHYKMLLEGANKQNLGKSTDKFIKTVHNITHKYIKELEEDIKYYCSMYDYRNNKGEQTDWKNSKDSVERAISFLTGSTDVL